MRNLVLILALASISLPTVFAKDNNNDTIYIKSSNFVSPLIEKWVGEYEKINPDVHFKLAGSNIKADDISIKLVTVEDENDNPQNNERVFVFGRYAILPIVGKESSILKEFHNKKLNKKGIKELFFEKDLFSEEATPSKQKFDATVYSGINDVSVANTFASHFGYTIANFKGKKISGDDIYLINAISKDQNGVTVNYLSNIFDIKTRKLKDNISILPLDIEKKYKEYITESANIDNIIELLESTSIDLIPVENIGFAYNADNELIKDFLEWVLTEGKDYNNTFGLLKPDEKVLERQIKTFNRLKDLTQK